MTAKETAQRFQMFTGLFATHNVQLKLSKDLKDNKNKIGEQAKASSNEERDRYFENFKIELEEKRKLLVDMQESLKKISIFFGHIRSNLDLKNSIDEEIGYNIGTLDDITADFNSIISSKDNNEIDNLVERLKGNIDTFAGRTDRINGYMTQLQDIYERKLRRWISQGKITIEDAQELLQNENLTEEQRNTINDIITAEKEKEKAEEDQKEESEQASKDKDNKGKRNIGPASASVIHKTRKQMKAEQQVQNQNRKARQNGNMPKELQQQLEKFAKEYVPKEGESYAEAVQKIILDYQIEQLEKEVQQLSADVKEIKKNGKKIPFQQAAKLQALHLQIETLKSDKFDLDLGKKKQKRDERMVQNQQQLDSLQQRLTQNQPKTSALSRYISAIRGKHLERLITELQSRQLVVATQQYCMVSAKYNTVARKVERASTIQADREVMMERAQERIKQLQALRKKVADEASKIYDDYGKQIVDRSVGAVSSIATSTSKTIKRGVSRLEDVLPTLRQAALVGFNGAAPMTSEQLYGYAAEEQKQR